MFGVFLSVTLVGIVFMIFNPDTIIPFTVYIVSLWVCGIIIHYITMRRDRDVYRKTENKRRF